MIRYILFFLFLALTMGCGDEMDLTGKLAPDFTLKDETGTAFTLSDFRGQDVVVYFYPKDDTPG